MGVFAFTVTKAYTTGKKKHSQSSFTEPNVIHYEGTWDAATGAVILGTIDLTDTTVSNIGQAATHVLRYHIAVDTGTVTDQICDAPNVDETGTAAEGKIGILVCVNDNSGTWWADVVV